MDKNNDCLRQSFKRKGCCRNEQKHTFKLDNVVELIGYNTDYVSVVQSPFTNKIKIYDVKGYEVDALDMNSSNYF